MKPRLPAGMASIAIVVAAALSLSACGASPEAQPTGEAKQDLTIAVPNISPPYNASNQANTALRITSNVFDPLIFMDPQTGELSPGIATSWTEVSDTEIDLKIRQDVRFHDGTPLTVDDVAFTLSAERLWGDKPLEPMAFASTLAGAEVIDDETVRVSTKQPDPTILLRLASPMGFVAPKQLIESEGIEAFGLAPVGTGPYKVDSVSPGESVELSANEDYWGGQPPYETLTFRSVPEVSARVSGLATGEYDISTNLPPDQTDLVESNGQKTASVQVNNVVNLTYLTAHAESPIADSRVRQALALAIDQKSINESFWGDGVPVPDGLNLPVYGDFYNEDEGTTGQDIKKAKKLLSEAGYNGEPLVLRYITGFYTNGDKALEAMLPMWEEAGINVQLDAVADYTLLDWPSADIVLSSTNILIPDPVSPMWIDWAAPNSNYVAQGRGINSPEFTAAVQEVAESLDEDDRKVAFDEASKLWNESPPALMLWQPLDIYGLGSGVDVTPDPRYWLRLAPVPNE